MRANRVHYTWNNNPKKPNCLNNVQSGHMPEKKASILGIAFLLGLFFKLKDK